MTKKVKSAFTLAEGGHSPLLYGDEGVAEGYSCVETKGHKFHHTSQSSSPRLVKRGFTLAEVLITLGVIGVVAAVTLPTLIQQYKERETVERVNQFYSIFSQAYLMAIQEHGTLDQWGLKPNGDDIQNEDGTYRLSDDAIQSANTFFDIMSKYLKYASYSPFTADPIYDENGVRNSDKVKLGPQLANGVAIRAIWFNTEAGCVEQNHCANFYITTDGGAPRETKEDGSNPIGKRTFNFIVQKDKIVPRGFDNKSFKSGCLSGNNYSHCTGWVIRNKNMDYLHCNDLDMNTKTKCK